MARRRRPKAIILFWRAALLRCPACAYRPLFSKWFYMVPVCPGCGWCFERDPGYWTGSMGINIIVAELVWAALFVLAAVVTWPTPPWQALTWASVALMVLLPLAFFPWSRTLWIAFDLFFRPVEGREFRRQ